MEIVQPKRYEKTLYKCECKACSTKVEAEGFDLHYAGGTSLFWTCPACASMNLESIRSLRKGAINVYKTIEKCKMKE